MIILYLRDSSGYYSPQVQKSNGILVFKGDIKNLLDTDIQIPELRIALEGFKKLRYFYVDGDKGTHLSQRSYTDAEHAPHGAMNPTYFSTGTSFDYLLTQDQNAPMRRLDSGGPHATFIDLYKLGMCGVLNDSIPIFTPPNIDIIGSTNFANDIISGKNLPPSAKYTKVDPDEMPTYYIVSKSAALYLNTLTLQDREHAADLNLCLVPVKLHPLDHYFAGFIPVPYLLNRTRALYVSELNLMLNS